jgi:glutamate dehydrogenase
VLDWPCATRQRASHTGWPSRRSCRGRDREASAFLEWLADNHFTFLGYREYTLERGRASERLVVVKGSGLGLLRVGGHRPRTQATELKGELRRRAREDIALFVTKANSVSTVHRATYLDYVGVKTFDARGRVTGERRFIGLFTSSTYSTHPRDIPLLRHKVRKVIDHIGVSPVSHDGKALTHVLETYPRDELFQSSVAELDRIARGIVNLYERRRVRLFIRRDPFQRYFSCMLFVPRDRYNTQVRGRIEQILREELSGVALETRVQISESALARLHTLVRTPPGRDVRADVDRIERRITATLRTWSDGLRDELRTRYAPERAFELGREFGDAFPVAYQEDVPAPSAIPDIEELLALPAGTGALGLQLRGGEVARKALHLRLYRRSEPLAMSDLLPLLENFDLRILNERPYTITPAGGQVLWIRTSRSRTPAAVSSTRPSSARGSMKRSSRSGRDAPKATVSIGSSRPRGSTGDRQRCCERSAGTCCRPASRSASGTWSPCSRVTPKSPRPSPGRSRRASTPRCRARRASHKSRRSTATSPTRSTRSRARTTTASCARFSR